LLGQHAARPLTHGPAVGAEEDEEPEPEEGEYLLVVEVDGQHALNCVAVAEVRVAEFSYSEIAHHDLQNEKTIIQNRVDGKSKQKIFLFEFRPGFFKSRKSNPNQKVINPSGKTKIKIISEIQTKTF
jgi:hypothetical protein